MHKILLVDDDDSLRGFVAAALRKNEFDVIEANDGDAAWDMMQTQSFDLLLTDIVMPNMDGVELSTKAICADPNIKVMFMTGFSGMTGAIESKTTVISKPFHLNDIVVQVQKTLEK